MIEQRALTRTTISTTALIHFEGKRGVLPCMVRNIHCFGAGIRLQNVYLFPLDFLLSFDGFRTIRQCHIKWLDGLICGVTFDPASAASDRSRD